MQEKKQPGKAIPLPELKSSVTEILVANGRSFQPFIRTFTYTDENITKSNLGTLIGVFEIDEMTEDCAYIVNFLASVAKKEYFNNPRRGAIESFEAALHKINLALSELVKHGNIAWLGKFHGVLGVLEKNNVHFSATGQAKILLLRNNIVSDISVGLASLESHIHPIKTFVEVSSGKLTLHDRIFFASPELLALFSLEDLTKNAKRMNHAQFIQFLKTALINELDLAGMLLVDVHEEILPTSSKKEKKISEKKSQERILNIFSEKAFALKKSNEISSVQNDLTLTENAPSENPEKQEEYIDTKTGHIYVQGDKPRNTGGNPRFEQALLRLEEFLDATKFFLLAQSRWIYKGKKRLLLSLGFIGEETRSIGRKIVRTLRKQWKKRPSIISPTEPVSQPMDTLPNSVVPEKNTPALSVPSEKTFFPQETKETADNHDTAFQKHFLKGDLPSFIKEKLTLFYQDPTTSPRPGAHATPLSSHLRTHVTDNIKSIAQFFSKYSQKISHYFRLTLSQKHRIPKTIATFMQKISRLFISLPKNRKIILIGSAGVLLLGIVIFFLVSSRVPQNSPSAPDEIPSSQPPIDTLNTLPGGEIFIALDTASERIVTSVILNNETYVITEKNIISVIDKKSFPIPGGSKALFATAMDDLRLIFIYTERGALYAWSPLSKTFVENTLALSEGSSITGIDTYLTYLYILDSENNQVYRFPRALSGFGTSIPWLKETLPIESTSRLAVNENLFIATDSSTIKGFFRGRITNTFETPSNGLDLTDLYTHPGLINVYGLDKEHRKIYVWNQEGKLLQEFSHEKFSDGQTLSVNEKQNEIFITTDNTLLSFKFK